ncbi:hypothetical protein B0H14DRAFT_2568785 [Mycena olivaceomarginata]|nr:hypothetical protein B0H14DRAFT_2568785 [Mycena olivaceomarginata]
MRIKHCQFSCEDPGQRDSGGVPQNLFLQIHGGAKPSANGGFVFPDGIPTMVPGQKKIADQVLPVQLQRPWVYRFWWCTPEFISRDPSYKDPGQIDYGFWRFTPDFSSADLQWCKTLCQWGIFVLGCHPDDGTSSEKKITDQIDSGGGPQNLLLQSCSGATPSANGRFVFSDGIAIMVPPQKKKLWIKCCRISCKDPGHRDSGSVPQNLFLQI